MAIDWLITWPQEEHQDVDCLAFMKLPDVKMIREVLEDFLGDICEDITEHSPGFLSVTLVGKHSQMFRRHGIVRPARMGQDKRWFEVWVEAGGITVTTRMADDVTNGLASIFAERCATRWDGKLERPS